MSQGAVTVWTSPSGHPACLASTCSVYLPVAFIPQKLKLWDSKEDSGRSFGKGHLALPGKKHGIKFGPCSGTGMVPVDGDSGIAPSTYMCDRSQCNRDVDASRVLSTGESH